MGDGLQAIKSLQSFNLHQRTAITLDARSLNEDCRFENTQSADHEKMTISLNSQAEYLTTRKANNLIVNPTISTLPVPIIVKSNESILLFARLKNWGEDDVSFDGPECPPVNLLYVRDPFGKKRKAFL